MKNVLFALLLLTSFKPVHAQVIKITEQTQNCSLRGLSVVDDHIAWASGSKGHVGISTNGGKTWHWQQVKGFEQSDFRDVEAFSAKEAVIMSSGTPALILKTTDGGLSWQVTYRNDDKAFFLDAMAFATPKHGYTMGDPTSGKFLLLETKDGGNTWAMFKSLPPAQPGEAAFAASGTCIAANNNNVYIVTGGSVARLLSFYDKGSVWKTSLLPLAKGKDSKGAFSIAFGKSMLVIAGGDYQYNHRGDSVACYQNGGTFTNSKLNPAGYQSCVTYINGSTFVSTGTPGTNITTDGGKAWKQIDTLSFNVCQKARRGKLVLLAGDKGKIARLEIY